MGKEKYKDINQIDSETHYKKYGSYVLGCFVFGSTGFVSLFAEFPPRGDLGVLLESPNKLAIEENKEEELFLSLFLSSSDIKKSN